jgi:DNA-directed RNA polymerase specialized sigma24 family protein
MSQKAGADKKADLREFIKENDQGTFDFCHYMLHGVLPVDEFVIQLFKNFSTEFRRLERAKGQWDSESLRLRLFQFTWEKIRAASVTPVYMTTPGRDMRSLRQMDEDILDLGESKDKNHWARHESAVLERLARVDFEFRAPLVLRDVLGFTDEQAVQILSLRWAVYRHRLHRGRVDFKDALRGWPIRAAEDRKGSVSA